MKPTLLPILITAALALSLPTTASAQKRKTAAAASPAAAQPAAPDDSEKPVSGEAGTTIVGEQESPIGLYITPWKDEYAERGMDRPARLLDEELLPIDKATFSRQVEYFAKIDAYRKAKLAAGETIK
jgi:hypothetical protein